jgi:dolichol-phosphate mannosyltransferase
MPRLELAVVVPTFNERLNVQPLLKCLAEALEGIEYEVIFVDDDSPDSTAALVRSIGLFAPGIRVIQRIDRRGLSSACIEGMMSTSAPYIAVMDADLQHDETILQRMLEKLKAEDLDLVVATRNIEGGSMGDFSAARVRLSDSGRRLGAMISKCDLSDPMSGFFILNRRFLDEVSHSLSGIGFKILLDLVSSSKRPIRLGEVPYRFRQRVNGESKLDILVAVEYLQLLLDKLVGDIIPPRYVIFGLVGGIGAAIHLSILFLLLKVDHHGFAFSQTIAAITVMTLNFFLNNGITYRDQRLKGRAIVFGLASFYLACSVGALINLRVALFAVQNGRSWFLAGFMGLAVSSVWNYAVSSVLTWRRKRAAADAVIRRHLSEQASAETQPHRF